MTNKTRSLVYALAGWLFACTNAGAQAADDWVELLGAANYDRAVPVLEIAAYDGDALAALNLAQIYDFGLHGARDTTRAIIFYRIALAGKVAGSWSAFGQFLIDHTSPHVDYVRGRELLAEAARRQDPAAYIPLSLMALTGAGEATPDALYALELACLAQDAGLEVRHMALLKELPEVIAAGSDAPC